MKINDLQDDRPIIYILIGVPGSGKSTWTKNTRAASDKEFVVVSSDDVLDRLGAEHGLTYPQAFEKFMGYADREAREAFAAAIESRSNIIYDRTNVSAKKRRGILQDLPNEYIKVAVEFKTADAEVARRLKSREEATGKHIPPEVMKDMYSKWESPTRAEGFDQIIKV